MKSWDLPSLCEKNVTNYVNTFWVGPVFYWEQSLAWTQNDGFGWISSLNPPVPAARPMVFEKVVLRALWTFFDNFWFFEKLWFQFVHFWGFPWLWECARSPKICINWDQFGKNQCAPPHKLFVLRRDLGIEQNIFFHFPLWGSSEV